MALLKQTLPSERQWYKSLHNNKDSWTSDEQPRSSRAAESSGNGKRAKAKGSSGQSRKQRLERLEGVMTEKREDIAGRFH